MPDIISECDRKARKPHTCSYCGQIINPGEIYHHAVLKYDDIYQWNSHKKCDFVSGALWAYIDPDEGMTEDDFQEGCSNFCREFICPNCATWDDESGECRNDLNFCVDKIYDFLQTHDFKRVKDKHGWTYTFKCFPKEAAQAGEGGK